MPRLTKIYTRTGDDGTTALAGGRRVSKAAARVTAYGTVDELNSSLGVALASGCSGEVTAILSRVQNELFHLGADLCFVEEDKSPASGPTVERRHVEALEEDIDRLSAGLEALENFILPGGSRSGAQLHLARTVCRRAERCVVRLAAEEAIGAHVLRYLNRLSDFLFCAARFENARSEISETLWDSRI